MPMLDGWGGVGKVPDAVGRGACGEREGEGSGGKKAHAPS